MEHDKNTCECEDECEDCPKKKEEITIQEKLGVPKTAQVLIE